MASQGDINNHEDPYNMQNNAFARNPVADPAQSTPGNNHQGAPNPPPVIQGYGYPPFQPYGYGPPPAPPTGQWGTPNINQMPPQYPLWDPPHYAQHNPQSYEHTYQPGHTRGHQQPVAQYGQPYGQQRGLPHGQQRGPPYGQQRGPPFGQRPGPPFGQQPAPQPLSSDQLRQKLKEPATDEFKYIIRNFDEAEQCYNMYLRLSDEARKPLEDIRGREGMLIGRLYSAIRYAVRDEEEPEAENPASGPGGQGSKKRKRTGTKGQIDAAIRRKSGIELEMVCHQLLDAIRDAQAGKNKIPMWLTAKPHGYGKFDTLDGRFNAVEQVLMDSKSMTKSLFDGADWQARIAWNPVKEFQRKSSNKQINKERAVLLKAGNAVIRGRRNNDANDAQNDGPNDKAKDDEPKDDEPKADEPMADELDAGDFKADDSEPPPKALKTVHSANLPDQEDISFGLLPQGSALPVDMELNRSFSAMDLLMPIQGAPEFSMDPLSSNLAAPTFPMDPLLPTQGAPELPVDPSLSTQGGPMFPVDPSLSAQGVPFPMAAPPSTQGAPQFISDTPLFTANAHSASLAVPSASLGDPSASLAVPSASLDNPSASLDNPSASLDNPSSSQAVPSAPLNDPLEGLGPLLDYVAAPSSQAAPSMNCPVAGQVAPVVPFDAGNNESADSLFTNNFDALFDGDFDFDKEVEDFPWDRGQDDQADRMEEET